MRRWRGQQFERAGRAATLTTAITAITAIAVATVSAALTTTVAAQTDEPEPLAFGALDLALVDHGIDVGAGGDLVVTYEVTGALDEAELLFIDQVDADTDADTSPDGTSGEDSGATDVSPVEPAEPAPPRELSVDVRIDDRLDETADLIGRLGRNPLPAAFADAFDGIRIDDVRPFIDVAADGRVTLTLPIGTDTSPSQADRLGIDEPGLYPILVTLRVDGVDVARHGTVLHRTGPRPIAATVGLAGFAAVTQPTSILTADELDPLVDDASRIVEFAEVVQVPLTVSIPPPVVDRLVSGTSAGAIVTQSLRDDTVQSLPATPFDISSAVAIGRGDAFVSQLNAGEEQLQTALPGVPVRRDVWLVEGPISTDAAALMRSLGVRMLVMTADVAATTLEPPPEALPIDRFVAVPLPDGTSLPALILDEVSATFGSDATEQALDDGTSTEWAIDYLARLRLGIADDTAAGVDPLDGRGRVLTGDRLGPLDPQLLNELVRLDARTSIHQVVDASTFSSTVASAEIEPPPALPAMAGPSLESRVAEIESTALVVINAASMLTTDDERASNWTRLLDALVSTAYTDEQVDAAINAIVTEADDLTSSVIAPEPFTLTLTSREETIPIAIESTADEPLRVRLELSSQRLLFPSGDPEVVLAPNAITEIDIPVEARTNGTTSIELRIVTPLGSPLTEPVQISARVQALSGVAQLATAVLIILLLTWWFSHWRARRRDAPTTDTSNPDGDENPDVATDVPGHDPAERDD